MPDTPETMTVDPWSIERWSVEELRQTVEATSDPNRFHAALNELCRRASDTSQREGKPRIRKEDVLAWVEVGYNNDHRGPGYIEEVRALRPNESAIGIRGIVVRASAIELSDSPAVSPDTKEGMSNG